MGSLLNHHLRQQGHHAILQALFRELIKWRQTLPSLVRLDKDSLLFSPIPSVPRRMEGKEILPFFQIPASIRDALGIRPGYRETLGKWRYRVLRGQPYKLGVRCLALLRLGKEHSTRGHTSRAHGRGKT